jgi:hypothetical protein
LGVFLLVHIMGGSNAHPNAPSPNSSPPIIFYLKQIYLISKLSIERLPLYTNFTTDPSAYFKYELGLIFIRSLQYSI